MGVIEWSKTEYNDSAVSAIHMGWMGDVHVASISEKPRGNLVELLLPPTFPGEPTTSLFSCFSTRDAKAMAEHLLQEWLDSVGLIPKTAYDDLHDRYSKLNASLGDRYLEIRDLHDENAVLKERIGAAFGDIDDAITELKRKVDDIVADTGVARTWSWDVPIDEWWKGAKPKHRTEADFRNADIDANGYVTFRNGGAA